MRNVAEVAASPSYFFCERLCGGLFFLPLLLMLLEGL